MSRFDWIPEVYLERIRTQIPRYDELQEQAIAAIPFPPERVLELGMGTGETPRPPPRPRGGWGWSGPAASPPPACAGPPPARGGSPSTPAPTWSSAPASP